MARAATEGEVLAVAEGFGSETPITMDDLTVAAGKVVIAREHSRRLRLAEGELIDWREGSL